MKKIIRKEWIEKKGICWVRIQRYLTIAALKWESKNGRQRNGEELSVLSTHI